MLKPIDDELKKARLYETALGILAAIMGGVIVICLLIVPIFLSEHYLEQYPFFQGAIASFSLTCLFFALRVLVKFPTKYIFPSTHDSREYWVLTPKGIRYVDLNKLVLKKSVFGFSIYFDGEHRDYYLVGRKPTL
ncbi:MAG: hypothetical protein M1485_00945 [Chloroflexi bacterium]|nr:hypothetical protein [Chloroflexota bacterium]